MDGMLESKDNTTRTVRHITGLTTNSDPVITVCTAYRQPSADTRVDLDYTQP